MDRADEPIMSRPPSKKPSLSHLRPSASGNLKNTFGNTKPSQGQDNTQKTISQRPLHHAHVDEPEDDNEESFNSDEDEDINRRTGIHELENEIRTEDENEDVHSHITALRDNSFPLVDYPAISLHDAPPNPSTGAERRVSARFDADDPTGAWAITDGPEDQEECYICFKDPDGKQYDVYTAGQLRDKVKADPKLWFDILHTHCTMGQFISQKY